MATLPNYLHTHEWFIPSNVIMKQLSYQQSIAECYQQLFRSELTLLIWLLLLTEDTGNPLILDRLPGKSLLAQSLQ